MWLLQKEVNRWEWPAIQAEVVVVGGFNLTGRCNKVTEMEEHGSIIKTMPVMNSLSVWMSIIQNRIGNYHAAV